MEKDKCLGDFHWLMAFLVISLKSTCSMRIVGVGLGLVERRSRVSERVKVRIFFS